jgi:PAS domain S-box-containing protein
MSTSSALETRLLGLQVAEVYRFAPTAAAFSFFGALITLGVLIEIGDTRRAALWFFYATAVTFCRALLIVAYRRRPGNSDPRKWATGTVATNALAGVQWGVLGTVLFPSTPVYAQLFAFMVIICFVAGSTTAYSAVRGAHAALAIPATLPTAAYVFFVHDGVHLYAGIAALFFCFAIFYYAGKLHRHHDASLRLQIERDDLAALSAVLNRKLEQEKSDLVHRAAVRTAAAETAREEAARLVALFERSPLPQLRCDANGGIVAANGAAQRLFGRNRGQLLGSPMASLLAGSGASGARFSEVTLPEIVAVNVVGPDGGKLACTASLTPLPPVEGRRAGFGVVLTGVPARVE